MSKVFSFKENHPTPVTNDHDHSTFTQYYTWQKGENMYMWEKESILGSWAIYLFGGGGE